ncbi:MULTISPECIES: HAD family hydrolase [unclassified Dehalobacter]|uniref:HAD family hydrolase n=1 Tax=unclassified Dehalobacter TaxID=2635733 RepID=UPI0021108DA5|nr:MULTISPECIES: HAD family hydrolase [unclassified Dehalobacter]
MKLAVFDIDGTLAPTDDPITAQVACKLRSLERQGIRIVFISGRTTSYLAGLARGIGICQPLVAGENGGVIFEPLRKWEKKLEAIPHQVGEVMKQDLLKKFPDLWFQPNQTMLTATPKDFSTVNLLYQAVQALEPVKRNKYKINRYDDCVEVMPKENSKGRALAVVKEILGIRSEEVIVFGNTIVDLPMKDETNDFLMIGDAAAAEGISSYPCIEEALDYLESNL